MAKLFANSGDPYQSTHSVESDLGLYCFPITLLVSLDYNGLNIHTYIHFFFIFYHYFFFSNFNVGHNDELIHLCTH